MVLTPSGEISECIRITNSASKGKSGGRIIPMHNSIRSNLEALIDQLAPEGAVIKSERSKSVAPQMIVNLFRGWYSDLGLAGCSSHSGRRTFLTLAARKINLVGGSIRDIQALAGHQSLQTTQRYIESDEEAQKRIIGII
jgi:integrase/recombinase XerD